MMCGALYIHVPFCLGKKCPYCDFYSIPYREELADAYTDRLCRILSNPAMTVGPFQTIYFGGGTPSLLEPRRVGRVLGGAGVHGIAAGAEITMECNPGDLTHARLSDYRKAGVNRLSIGLQSANDHLLQLLGRRHTARDVAQAASMAAYAGFEHLSFDLMLGLPDQGTEEILQSIQFCGDHGAEHVSAYMLKVEENTPFAASGMAGRCPAEDTQADYYLFAVEALRSHGYEQYEISNFAKDGHIARHNYQYWDCGEYLGLGPAAHSFLNGRRFAFPRDLERFLSAENAFSITEDLGPGGGAYEYLMLRLRLKEGIRWDALEDRYPGQKLRERLTKSAEVLDGTGLLELDTKGIRLTSQGMLVSNSVLCMLIPDELFGESSGRIPPAFAPNPQPAL